MKINKPISKVEKMTEFDEIKNIIIIKTSVFKNITPDKIAIIKVFESFNIFTFTKAAALTKALIIKNLRTSKKAFKKKSTSNENERNMTEK